MFRLAFSPNKIPAGLIKNKLAVPLASINPSILEIFPPVTLEKMLLILSELLNVAEPPLGTQKS